MNQLINSRSGKRIHGAWYLAYLIFLLISLPVTGQENTQLPEGQQTVNISGGKIWYHVIGEGHKLPVLMLHGGPGGTCYSLYALAGISEDRQIILFDQIGTGRSGIITDTALMTMEYQVEQLHEFIEALGLKKFILYGHSWGTMLALDYYLTYPDGISAMIMNSPLVSTACWIKDADTLISTLPDSVQYAIRSNEQKKTYDDPKYQEANYIYYRHFISRGKRVPNRFGITRAPGNNMMYEYMWGPSEFTATGTLRNYDRLDRLKEIKVPVLWITGEYDEARPSTVKYYSSLTPGSVFRVIPGAAHGTMHDNQEDNINLILEYLSSIKL